MAQEVAGRAELVEVAAEPGRRPAPAGVTAPGTSSSASGSRSAAASTSRATDGLAFPLEHAVDRPLGVIEHLAGDERGAVAAHERRTSRAGAILVALARSMTSGMFAR